MGFDPINNDKHLFKLIIGVFLCFAVISVTVYIGIESLILFAALFSLYIFFKDSAAFYFLRNIRFSASQQVVAAVALVAIGTLVPIVLILMIAG